MAMRGIVFVNVAYCCEWNMVAFHFQVLLGAIRWWKHGSLFSKFYGLSKNETEYRTRDAKKTCWQGAEIMRIFWRKGKVRI